MNVLRNCSPVCAGIVALLFRRHVVRRYVTCVAAVFLCAATVVAAPPGLKKLTSPPVDPRLLPQIQSLSVRSLETPAALTDTFTLHSRQAATKTIYLDFRGHDTTGTVWNSTSVPTITTAPFSLDADVAYSDAELTMMQEIWQRVSECFSPFDVDVTTQIPPIGDLMNSGSGDTRWGIRVLIGASTPSPAPGSGGVAYIGSFKWDSDTPCFVFPGSLSNAAKPIADASIHEVGHTLGLVHDGRLTPVEAYYFGHGSGPTGWAPHMGAGYSRNLVQWSKGEYLSANNQEDDLAIITTQNGFTYRIDDYANSITAAKAIAGVRGAGATANTFKVTQTGVIEQQSDTDWFKLITGAGNLTLNAVGGPKNTMIDIQMDLYSVSGQLIVSSNPVDDVIASINQDVSAGVYYVKIDGVGKGSALVTGYTDYSSLGQYTITGKYVPPPLFIATNVTATYDSASATLTLTGDAGANSLTVKLQAGVLTVEGANGTNINNTPTASWTHTGSLTLNANLLGGNDSLSVVGVDGSGKTFKIRPGTGNDNVAFTLCNIGTLDIDGDTGVDVLITTSTVIGKLIEKNIP